MSDLKLFAEKETNLGEKFFELSNEYDYLILYGCGAAVTFYLKWLEKHNINKPIYLVDGNRTGEIDGHCIYSRMKDLEEIVDLNKTAVIISSPKYRKEITEELKNIVPDRNIFSFEAELNVNFGLEVEEYRKYVINHIDDFYQLKEWFVDSFSFETMESVIKGRITSDLDYYEQVAVFPQYFGNDFLNKNVYYRFVDCGAYIGDTFNDWEDFIKCNLIPIEESKYFGLEPDAETYRSLKKEVEGKEGYANIYEVGAWNSSGVLRFQTTTGGTSRVIENEENNEINVVRLDELLSGEKITMIKMDYRRK